MLFFSITNLYMKLKLKPCTFLGNIKKNIKHKTVIVTKTGACFGFYNTKSNLSEHKIKENI